MFCINSIKQQDISLINILLDETFGGDRLGKTAYRLRDGVPAVQELSFVVRSDGGLKASLQFWPIEIQDGDRSASALLLGPIAVAKDCRGQRMGLKLMEHGLETARKLGYQRVILVGDQSYYQKVGFSRSLAVGLEMPGPVNKDRLLAQELVPGAMNGIKGMISKIK
ncbi:MAG: GNAT family N-acetyltransferase [Alphaproteobacteria bacterium]|nr:MAG: GNAT family N-acetyltransferase [Alphaproteobacteria bacterium]